MRGLDQRTGELFSYVDLEARVRPDHPLRAIRAIVKEAYAAMEAEFASLYARIGHLSIPPKRLLRAMLLQAFYSVRSERQLMERLDHDLLFRWFVGLGIGDPAWDHSPSSRTATGCSKGTLQPSSSRPCWPSPGSSGFSLLSTSQSTAPWSKRGP
jgi:transposase